MTAEKKIGFLSISLLNWSVLYWDPSRGGGGSIDLLSSKQACLNPARTKYRMYLCYLYPEENVI